MGRADYLALGDWNVQCFECGKKMKASQAVRNWQGYYVHPEHNEPRQLQDFARATPDNQTPPWTQPWPTASYTYTDQQIGMGDGVNTFFQLGSGLYTVTITAVTVDGTAATYTDNSVGGITLASAPAKYSIVKASGTESVS